jgi:hypothetical protein
MFDPRDWTIFVETDEDIANSTVIGSIDVSGWLSPCAAPWSPAR